MLLLSWEFVGRLSGNLANEDYLQIANVAAESRRDSKPFALNDMTLFLRFGPE